MKKLLILMILFPLVCFGQTRPHWFQISDKPFVSITEYGAKGDGTTDDRAAINSALAGEDTVYFPPGIYAVSFVSGASALLPKNNQTIVLHHDAEIRLLPHSITSYQIFRLYDLENVSISGGILNGNKDASTGTANGQGHGIDVRNSININISNMVIKNCEGDGLYFGPRGTEENKRTHVQNIHIDGCRRQGISIISSRDLTIRDVLIENISGSPPESGIDIEPNFATDKAINVVMDNITIRDVAGGGFHLHTNGTPYVQVSVNNLKIDGASKGLTQGSWRGTLLPNQEEMRAEFSNVSISNVRSSAVYVREGNMDAHPLIIRNIVVRNSNLSEYSGDEGSVFYIFRTAEEDAAATWKIGNVHIYGADVYSPLASRDFSLSGRVNDYDKISFIDPVRMEGASMTKRLVDQFIRQGWSRDFVVRDSWGVLERPSTITLRCPDSSSGGFGDSKDRIHRIIENLLDNRTALGYEESSVTLFVESGTLQDPISIPAGVDASWIILSSGSVISVNRSRIKSSGAICALMGAKAPQLSSFSIAMDDSDSTPRLLYRLLRGAEGLIRDSSSLVNDYGTAAIQVDPGARLTIHSSTVTGSLSASNYGLDTPGPGQIISITDSTVTHAAIANDPAASAGTLIIRD